MRRFILELFRRAEVAVDSGMKEAGRLMFASQDKEDLHMR